MAQRAWRLTKGELTPNDYLFQDESVDLTAKTDLRELEQRLDLRFEQIEWRIDRVVVRPGAGAAAGNATP